MLAAANSQAEMTSSSSMRSGPYASLGIANLVRGDRLEITNNIDHFTFFRAPDNGNVMGLSLLLGYQKVIDKLIISGNGAYRYFTGPASRSVKLNAINAPQVRTNSNIGLELRPGFLIIPQASLYGIFGIESTYYNVKYLFNQTNTSFSGWQFGPGVGIGSDVAFTSKLAMQLNYLYVHYNNLNYSDHSSRTKVALEPTTNIFTFAISYQLS